MSELSLGLIHLGYNVGNNHACSNQATYQDIKDTWVHSDEVPLEKDIVEAIDKWKTTWEAKKYQRDRAIDYPSIQDVIVALAEKEEGDDTMWKEVSAKRQKVKTDNPKPE